MLGTDAGEKLTEQSVFGIYRRRRFTGEKCRWSLLSTNTDWVQPERVNWQAPNLLEERREKEIPVQGIAAAWTKYGPGKNIHWNPRSPPSQFLVFQSLCLHLSLLSLVWWMKDGCDASKRNLQITDPLKPTSVNTNKTSLDTLSSVQGIHSTRRPGGGKLLPKNYPLFRALTWNWNLPPHSSPFPALLWFWVN